MILFKSIKKVIPCQAFFSLYKANQAFYLKKWSLFGILYLRSKYDIIDITKHKQNDGSMMARKLTLKQNRFITEYLKSGNATQAIKDAGYNHKDDNSAGVQAYEYLRKPQIQDAIAQALTSAEITPEWILLQFKQIATTKHVDGISMTKTSDKLRALENLAKYKQLTGFTNQPANTFNGDITISFGQPDNANVLPATTVIDIET